MATAIAQAGNVAKSSASVPGRRFDHLFFSSMTLLMLATVFLGFARTYYLAGVFHAPLPSAIVHIHGAAFSCWMLLLITQTSLVAAGRVDLHRRLGIAGFVLGCLMVILGAWAATDSLVRAAGPPGRDVLAFYIVPMMGMVIFATFLGFAFRARRNPAEHKRLIYIATTALLIAAVSRWPFAFVNRKPPVAGFCSYFFLLTLVSYDLWSTRKIHRATLWAGAFLIILQQSCYLIGPTAAWHALASWVQTHAR